MSTSRPSFRSPLRAIKLKIVMSSILTYTLVNVLIYAANIHAGGWTIMLLTLIQYIPAFTLVPRFILSLRELYARDLQGRQGGDIDSAFGLTLAPGHDAAGTIMFADGGQNEGEEI